MMRSHMALQLQIHQIFCFVDGAFSQFWEGFEKRHSQEKLIKDAYKAFTEEQILVAEAGTGLGKSLAYISAGYLAGVQRQVPMIISTHTKTLQSQLFSNDIPKFAKAIDQPLKSVIYKGKHNYICRTRLNQLMQNQLRFDLNQKMIRQSLLYLNLF